MIIYLASAAVAAILVWSALRYFKGQRRRAMQAVAEAAAVRLEDFGPAAALLEGTGLPFFVDGRAAIGRLLLELPREDGAKAYYFDYSCLLGSGQGQRRKQATVALFDFEKGAFPDFYVSAAEESLDESTALEPVDMSAFTGFPEGMKLFGRDPEALKKFFGPEIAACFGEHPGWSAQGSGRWLLLYKGCSLVSPAGYGEFMAEAGKLAFNLA